jgi:hypothetical protein
MNKEKWEITIINELEDGYIVMSPIGDTLYITKEEYQELKNNNNVERD